MKIRKVWTVVYSATGNTKAVAEAAAKAAAETLGVSWEAVDFSVPAERERERTFTGEDLVFAATPTYAGKMPNKLLPDFQEKLRGNGGFAAAIVTFGNRSYDNALAELCVTLERDGFHTVSGGAFVGQHAFAVKLAAGRPDADDLVQAGAFGVRTAEKVRDLGQIPAPVAVPGDADAPYYVPKGVDGAPAKFLKSKPKTREELCDGCGICAAVCPMRAIDPEDVLQVPGVCIKCHACVRKCPTGAKYFDDPAFLSHLAMLEQNFTAEKENELFF